LKPVIPQEENTATSLDVNRFLEKLDVGEAKKEKRQEKLRIRRNPFS
jgi:hypothetical protein